MPEFVAGLVLLAAVFGDFLQTTLGAQRAGPLTRAVSGAAWAAARGCCGFAGRWAHRYTGPATLSLVAANWIGLHWLAWTLIFRSDPAAIVMSRTGEPAGVLETAAYVGAMLSTLGAARAEASTALWDVASALAAVNGMVVLTLSVTFVVNITRTVTEGRAFAVLVDSVEPRDADHFALLRTQLAGLLSQFAAFPLAHSFSTPARERRVVPAILAFVDRVLDAETLPSLRPVLALLPGVDATGDLASVKAAVARWAEQHTLGDPRARH